MEVDVEARLLRAILDENRWDHKGSLLDHNTIHRERSLPGGAVF